jgi:hypothetical protein
LASCALGLFARTSRKTLDTVGIKCRCPEHQVAYQLILTINLKMFGNKCKSRRHGLVRGDEYLSPGLSEVQ